MRQHSDSSFIFNTTAHYLVAPAQGPQNGQVTNRNGCCRWLHGTIQCDDWVRGVKLPAPEPFTRTAARPRRIVTNHCDGKAATTAT